MIIRIEPDAEALDVTSIAVSSAGLKTVLFFSALSGIGLGSMPENSVWSYPVMAAGMGIVFSMPNASKDLVFAAFGFTIGMIIAQAPLLSTSPMPLDRFAFGLLMFATGLGLTTTIRNLLSRADESQERA